MDETKPTPRLGRRRRENLIALAAFVLLSVIVYGHGVIAHPTAVFAGIGIGPGRDQAQIAWCLDWVARALRYGGNPFFSDAAYVPHGYPLAWAPSLTGPGMLLSPLTLSAGPIVTFNLLAITAPGVAAWTAYLLCRTAVPSDSPWPALAGGLLFGFGSYETVESDGHLNLALIGLVPLIPLLAILRSRERLSRLGYVLLLGAVLGLQIYTSTEILATSALFGVLALLVWLALDRNAHAARLALESCMAVVVAALLGLPLLIELASAHFPLEPIVGSGVGIDFANVLTPTRATLLPDVGSLFINTAHRGALAVNPTESVGFIGVPLLLLLGLYFWQARRTLAARLLLIIAAAALIFALGEHLLFAGHVTTVPLPWLVVSRLPVYGKVIAARMMLFFWLAAAVAVAFWMAKPSKWRVALYALVLVTLLPATLTHRSFSRVEKPRLTTQPALMARTIPANSTVIALPWGIHGNSMLWQFQSEFHYRMVGGYLGPTSALEYHHYTNLLHALSGSRFKDAGLGAELCAMLRFTGASFAIVRGLSHHRSGVIFRLLGAGGRTVGGFRVYDLRGATAEGGRCSLTPARGP